MSSSAFHYFAESDPEWYGPDDGDDGDADARPYDPAGWYPEWTGPDADADTLADAYARETDADADFLASVVAGIERYGSRPADIDAARADYFARTYGTDAEGTPLGIGR